MATAMQILPDLAACEHHAFNRYEQAGDSLGPNIIERGKCCACQEWLEIDTDLMTDTVTYSPLDAATISRLLREQEQECFI